MEQEQGRRNELAAVFGFPGVAGAYRHRPPYPAEVFDTLEQIITDRPRRVLDIGAGEGALARPLARRVDQVDAVERSAAMVETGRRRPGGDHQALRWITGAAEAVPLRGPYALVTAGASLHWMPWRATLTRLAAAMTSHAYLAIVDHGHRDLPWQAGLTEIIVRHSRSPGYDPAFSLTTALRAAGLLEIAGHMATAPALFRQTVAAYIEQFHSTASLARELMPAGEAAAFDRAVAGLVRPYATDGVLDLPVAADVTWGRITVTAGS